jgi:hypothetical protein
MICPAEYPKSIQAPFVMYAEAFLHILLLNFPLLSNSCANNLVFGPANNWISNPSLSLYDQLEDDDTISSSELQHWKLQPRINQLWWKKSIDNSNVYTPFLLSKWKAVIHFSHMTYSCPFLAVLFPSLHICIFPAWRKYCSIIAMRCNCQPQYATTLSMTLTCFHFSCLVGLPEMQTFQQRRSQTSLRY